MNDKAVAHQKRDGGTISVDVMSGDHGIHEILPAVLQVLDRHQELRLLLVGDPRRIQELLGPRSSDPRLEIHPASEIVAMDELPSHALRKKPDASMRVAIDLVKQGAADACVSAGNTGALLAIAWYVLRMLPGIERPALCTEIPGILKSTHILDLGANLDPTPEQLLQFALMGSELVSAVENNPAPRIALLNVGTEASKGSERIKESAVLLQSSPLNYVGYAEGDQLFSGRFDLIVCDGFSGNIALKASEGVAKLILHLAREKLNKNAYGRFAAILSKPVLQEIKQVLDPRSYNGASLLGLRGIVIKSHGSADCLSFACALEEAVLEVKRGVSQRILSRMEAQGSEVAAEGKIREQAD